MRLLRVALLISLSWLAPEQVLAAEVSMDSTAFLQPDENSLRGNLELTLESVDSVYDLRVEVVHDIQSTLIHRQDMLAPATELPLQLDLPHRHPHPGRYHLLLAISFKDASSQEHSLSMAIPYGHLALGGLPTMPQLFIEGHTLNWDSNGAAGEMLGLDITTAPHWHLGRPVKYGDTELQLSQVVNATPPHDKSYRQYAVLNWLGEDAYHYSRLIPWEITGDALAQGSNDPWQLPVRYTPMTIAWLALTVIVGLATLCTRVRRPQHLQRLFDYAVVAALTLWLAHYLHPELWLLETWPTGGDLASHVLYAQRFSEWLFEGRITGWMPEVFAGFPAFRFYFPLPFAAIAVSSTLLPIQVAIKLAVVGPSVLLPAAVYWLGRRFHWPSGASLFASFFVVGFLVHAGSVVWGGNLLAVFAGEFAYSWGILMLLGFWGTLAWALEHGGHRWVAPALLLALTALSHGYPLLLAGFSALLAPLFTTRPFNTLFTVLKIQTTAFLLVGFWLIPLFEQIPYTIPNDTSVWLKSFSTFVPISMLPMLAALPLLPFVLRQPGAGAAGIGFLLLTALMSATAFLGAWALGLADIRLFPFTQLTVAMSLGAALGITLQRWGQETVNWSVAIAGLLLVLFWLPNMPPLAERAKWAMEGYEGKAMWPHYESLAMGLAGARGEPRVLFEHAPENTDVGSTRAMEALPLFGSRPVLEGLYMEAAFSGPFIYQLQAEVSKQPSSPLARFPSVRGTAKDLAERLDEFYTDTVVSRSIETAVMLNKHPAFQLAFESGPFKVFRLDNKPQLVEISSDSVSIDRDNWLESAYEHFVLASNNLAPNKPPGAEIEVLEFGDELLRFRTDSPGTPHRIKITYHPGWYSLGGEEIELTYPTFMQIVPDSTEVELKFGKTPGQKIGALLSIAGVLLLLAPVLNGPAIKAQRSRPAIATAIALFLGMASTAVYFHPSRNYHTGHSLLLQGKYLQAADHFTNAIPFRHARAHRAEALFWAGRSWEMAGKPESAVTYYRELLEGIPASYWAPESLYRLSEIAAERGDSETSTVYSSQLLASFPGNRWSDIWRQKKAQTHE